jgi:hypothetical protein
METILSTLFGIALLALLAYFVAMCVFEAVLALYRRLPEPARQRVDRAVSNVTRSPASF